MNSHGFPSLRLQRILHALVLLHEQPDHAQHLSAETRRRLHIFYLLVTTFALAVGVSGMVRAWREVGRPFGGFVWMQGYRDFFYIIPDVPHRWPGPESGLRPLDIILSVDGRPPSELSRVYDEKAGQTVVYEIRRAGQRLVIQGPVVPFTRQMFLEFYGPLFVAGLVALGAAYPLLRSAREPSHVLLSLILLAVGALELNHVYGPRVHTDYTVPLASSFVWAYAYPFIGAMLWHFSLTFPRPRAIPRERPALVRILYGVALGIGTVYLLSIEPVLLLRHLEKWAFPVFLASLASGALASIVGGIWAYIAPTVARDDPGRAKIRLLSVAWLVGIALYVYLGVTLYMTAGWTMLLTDFVVPLTILYPILLIYAVRNVQSLPRFGQSGRGEPVVGSEQPGCSDPLTPRGAGGVGVGRSGGERQRSGSNPLHLQAHRLHPPVQHLPETGGAQSNGRRCGGAAAGNPVRRRAEY